MSITIKINGDLISSDDIDGAGGVSFVYREKGADGESAFAFSPELRAYGEAYQTIKNIFLCDDGVATASASVEVFDSCCIIDDDDDGRVFVGRIDGAGLSWAVIPLCYVDFSIVDDSTRAKAVECLKNTIIWSDNDGATAGEDTARAARYVPYCIDMRPAILQDFVIVLGILIRAVIAPIIFAVAAIIGVINIIITAINLIPGVSVPVIDFDGNDDTNIFNEAATLLSLINEYTIGCGRSHKAPFYHSYLSNLCEICGLELSSSLFDPGGDYYNLMRLDASRTKGRRQVADIESAYIDNRPNLNGLQFLEELSAFNIDWKINDGALIVEPADALSGSLWFSLADIPANRIDALSFDVTTEKPAAYAEYNYQIDGLDRTGDEINKKYTESVIDWNAAGSPALSGLYEKTLQYGTPQFRRDALRRDVSPLDRPFYASAIGFPVLLNEYKNALLMATGTALLPKLLIWDGDDLPERRGLVRRYAAAGDLWHYQPELYIYDDLTEISPSIPSGINTLYQNLFYTDDPNAAGVRLRNFSLTLIYDCDLRRAAQDAPGRLVRLPFCEGERDGIVEEVEVADDGRTMTIKGKI